MRRPIDGAVAREALCGGESVFLGERFPDPVRCAKQVPYDPSAGCSAGAAFLYTRRQ